MPGTIYADNDDDGTLSVPKVRPTRLELPFLSFSSIYVGDVLPRLAQTLMFSRLILLLHYAIKFQLQNNLSAPLRNEGYTYFLRPSGIGTSGKEVKAETLHTAHRPKWVNQGIYRCNLNAVEDSSLKPSLSRQELLAWLNNLLQLNVTKVEQCGTGYHNSPRPRIVQDAETDNSCFSAALCQIYDSIFRKIMPLVGFRAC